MSQPTNTLGSNEHPVQSRRQCGAKTRSGEPCRTRPMPNGRCRLHGGKSLAGVASKTWRHGRYSRALPSDLLARYRETAADPDLLGLSDEVRLIDSKLQSLLAGTEEGAGRRIWRQLRTEDRRLREAWTNKDVGGIVASIERINELVRAGDAEAARWDQVLVLVEKRRRLVESERRHRVEAQRMVSVDEAWGLLATLTDAVRRIVKDDAQLREVAVEFAKLTGRPGPDEWEKPVDVVA